MTRKKPFDIPETARSGRVGLAVMRGQPLSRGHAALIARMMQDCDVSIVGFGSCQLSGVVRHPFTFDQRLDMVRTLFGDGFKPLQLVDIDAPASSEEWTTYVLDKIENMNLPAPTDYYTGSAQDAKWYVKYFARLDDPSVTVGTTKTYLSAFTGRRLHIVDRAQSGLPQAEEIRSLIERRDDEWKAYVPARLVPYVEHNYPVHLRVPAAG